MLQLSTRKMIKIPNWREHLSCRKCGLSMRLRAALDLIHSQICLKHDSNIYLTEQFTPLFKLLKDRYPNLVGSEFFGDSTFLGGEKNGIRNENLEKLTFAEQ